MSTITWFQGNQLPYISTGNCSTLYIIPKYGKGMLYSEAYRKSVEEELENGVYRVLEHASKEDVVKSLKRLIGYHNKFILAIQDKRIEKVVLKHNIPHTIREGLMIINGHEL